MKLIDGKSISNSIKDELAKQIERDKLTKKLIIFTVGEDSASKVYVRNKIKACEKVGIVAENIRFSEDSTEDELIKAIEKANEDKEVNGIIVQLPLPKHISDSVCEKIDPLKDVDGLTTNSIGRLNNEKDGYIPCTAKGIMKLLEDVDLDGKNVVIVGRSHLVGKPLIPLLLNENATVTIAHSHTKDLADVTSKADVLIVAVGKPKLIKENYVKDKAVVVDVGINRTEDGLCGDVDFENVKDKVSAITPVPGGVGPMTVAMLLDNVVNGVN